MNTPTVLDGIQYVSTTQAVGLLTGPPAAYPTPAAYATATRLWSGRLRQWVASPTVPLDVVRTPTGRPVQIPAAGGRGRQNVYRWLDIVEAEHTTATTTAGRPRSTP